MNFKVKNMMYCAMFACMSALLAQLQCPLPNLVPITLQTLGIYLIGLFLKPKDALISALIYLLMGVIGLPVFSGFNSGLSAILGPTGGYLFSFPIMALVISLIVSYRKTFIFEVLALFIGTIICYLIGTWWFINIMDVNLITALAACVFPFLLGDIIKIIIAIILTNKFKVIIKNYS